MNAPLAGIRVLELARILAGPWAGQMLADLGADVIKVESPEGDETRRWGPPFVDYADGGRDAAYFHSCNRGKRSVVADFRRAEGRSAGAGPVPTADVVIENFKRGDLARYGLDAATLRAAHPAAHLVLHHRIRPGRPLCRSPRLRLHRAGHGRHHGSHRRAGWRSGRSRALPMRTSSPACMRSLPSRPRCCSARARGEGAFIDMSLFDTQVAVLANQAMNFLVSGKAPRRMGNAHPNLVPYQVFRVADGDMVIAVGSDPQFGRLVRSAGDSGTGARALTRHQCGSGAASRRVIARLQAACQRFTRAALVQTLD